VLLVGPMADALGLVVGGSAAAVVIAAEAVRVGQTGCSDPGRLVADVVGCGPDRQALA
jgi:hypothetical protein